jgi:predicted transcriptional regulator
MGNKECNLVIVARALDAVNRFPSFALTRQCSAANLHLETAKALFDLLESKELLRICPRGGCRFNYHITNKGLDLLRQINRCYEALSDKPVLGVMQFA